MVIRCEYCGTEFNSRKGNCPNCGAASGVIVEKVIVLTVVRLLVETVILKELSNKMKRH